MGYRSTYRCSDCKHEFSRITKNLPKREPKCPKCAKANRIRFKSSVSTDTHPHIEVTNIQGGTPDAPVKAFSMGKSNFTKAMDMTADIVMKDYGMTNLKDNLREGDSMAPKLRQDLESKVDQVFAPSRKPVAGANAARSMNSTLMKQINSGAFKAYGGANDVVAKQQALGFKPKFNIMDTFDNRKPS